MVFLVAFVVMFAPLAVSAYHFFEFANLLGNEWDSKKVAAGFKKGYPNVLICTVLLIVVWIGLWLLLPEGHSLISTLRLTNSAWLPLWLWVCAFRALRGLYHIWRETRRVSKPWIAFALIAFVALIGTTIWYGCRVAVIALALMA